MSVSTKVKNELWNRGRLAEWKLRPAQLSLYDEIKSSDSKKFVVCCSRRFGKSYMMTLYAIEFALQNPGSKIKVAIPTAKNLRLINKPIMADIMKDCPTHLRPRYMTQDGLWRFPNGSEVILHGAENRARIENLRGTACDLALIDEGAFISELEYLVQDILLPMTLTSNGRIVVASTPPKDPRHFFVKMMAVAKAQDSYAHRTIHDEKTVGVYCEESGGEDSRTWRSEYLCEILPMDEDAVVIPEWNKNEKELVKAHKRPAFFIPVTVVDSGYLDCTGILLAYYDFEEAKIIIEDELMVNKKTTEEISILIKDIEKRTWGDIPVEYRVIDAPLQQIADFSSHGLECFPPAKTTIESMTNKLRLLVQSKGVLVNPRCKNLISQLSHAMWDNSRKKFVREDGHHNDLLAACVYLTTHAYKKNPFPANHGLSHHTHYIKDEEEELTESNILKLFG